MKVAFIQDLDPFTEPGGAQMTDKTHLLYAIRHGHDVEVVLPNADPSALFKSDLVVISNNAAFPIGLFQELQKQQRKYVFFLHDYQNLCRWRLFYPMLDKCKVCHLKEGWLPILQGAASIIWLSPLHRESWLFTYPELAEHDSSIIPSPVSVTDFFDMKQERHGYIAVHATEEFKGRERFLEYVEQHPEISFTLVGAPPDGLPANVKGIGYVPYSAMNELYNQHQAFVHLPTTTQPFERTIPEALLAGCKIIGNKNIGALSYPEFSQGREAIVKLLKKSSMQFLAALERAAS